MENTTKIYLSKQGLSELKKKIAKLEHEQRMLELELRDDDVKEDLLRQNDIFARIDLIRTELSEKNFQLHNAKILTKKRGKKVRVTLGSFVELLNRATGKIMRFQLVDSVEADPLKGKISADSPLGKVLIGAKIKEEVSWNAGVRIMNAQLLRIS